VQRLEGMERVVVGWMCGVSLRGGVSGEDLGRRFGVVEVARVVGCGRLWWFHHL